MEIENIYYLLGLILLVPLVVLVLLTIRWKKNIGSKLGEHRLVQQLLIGYSPKKFLLKALLPLVAIMFLIGALINIRKPDNNQKIKLSGTDLMVALDVSNSMLAKDIQPNRLEKSKLLISKLIDQLGGNRMGLVVFAGNAYLQMPLTSDASSAKLFLSTISPDLVPLQGTNIAGALQLCNRSLNNQEQKYKSILLISDGEDHDDAALSTAKELRKNGVIINTVGVGSPTGAPIQDRATNEMKRDDQGNVIMSKINEKELQDIASATNGSYQLLNEADAAAKNIAAQLEGMDKKPITDTTLTNYTSYYWLFILAAVLLLIIELLVTERKRVRKTKLITDLAPNKNRDMAPDKIPSAAKIVPLILLLLLTINSSFAQKENENVRKGNEAYKQQKFDEATKEYETALGKNKDNTVATFNLGNTQYKSGNYDVASKKYEALASNKDKDIRAKSLYNQGVSLVKQNKLKEAVDAFKQSLRADASDEETRENLQKALNALRQQEEKDKKDQKDDKKDKKDDKKEQDKKEQEKKEQEKKDKQQQEQEKKEEQQQKPKISKEDAKQKLEALQQEEKKLQQKLNQRQKVNVKQPEKDW